MAPGNSSGEGGEQPNGERVDRILALADGVNELEAELSEIQARHRHLQHSLIIEEYADLVLRLALNEARRELEEARASRRARGNDSRRLPPTRPPSPDVQPPQH